PMADRSRSRSKSARPSRSNMKGPAIEAPRRALLATHPARRILPRIFATLALIGVAVLLIWGLISQHPTRPGWQAQDVWSWFFSPLPDPRYEAAHVRPVGGELSLVPKSLCDVQRLDCPPLEIFADGRAQLTKVS